SLQRRLQRLAERRQSNAAHCAGTRIHSPSPAYATTSPTSCSVRKQKSPHAVMRNIRSSQPSTSGGAVNEVEADLALLALPPPPRPPIKSGSISELVWLFLQDNDIRPGKCASVETCTLYRAYVEWQRRAYP